MKNILFLTTAHRHDDDRIFFHQAKELRKNNFRVKISSLSSEFQGNIDDIEIESYSIIDQSIAKKKQTLEHIAKSFQPDCIICSEPLAVIAAKNAAKQNQSSIIYDITEWYPSMQMVAQYSFFLKFFHFFKFFLIQLYAGWIANAFIFGEKTKKFPLATFFPFKKSIILPYFPDQIYVKESIKKLNAKTIKLCYTGVFSQEKGVGNFLEVAHKLIKKRTDIEVSILLIGGSRLKKDEIYFAELLKGYDFNKIEIRKPVAFEKFTENFTDADICFDLREKNFENDHCLPIKIFYYAAAGKPVIYTDLKATRDFVNVSEFGYLVHPEHYDEIVKCIEQYVDDPALYDLHANNARKLYEALYNWDKIKQPFVDFVKKSIKNEQ